MIGPEEGQNGKSAMIRLARVVLAAACAGLFLFLLSPTQGHTPSVDNPLLGPLPLLRDTHVAGDKAIGWLVMLVSTPLIFACVIKPCRWTLFMSIVGIFAWVGFGLWIGSMAAC